MADTSVGGQSTVAPELVEILKALSRHRQKVWERAFGDESLATNCSNLEKAKNEFLKAVRADDCKTAGDLLCRFVDAAHVKCSEESRRQMLVKLESIMEARRAARASGNAEFNVAPSELGPEVEEAFAEWSGIDPKESAAWWHHPLRWLCREVEERLGIEREDLEIAAYRLTSELGLRGMGPLIAPDGTPDDDDKGQPYWLWMLPKFKELDRDGTTARLWQGLLEKFSAVLVEAKLTPVAGATLSTATAEQGEEKGGKKPQTAEPPSSHIIGDLRDTIRNREWSDGYMVIMHIPDSLVLQRLFAYGRQKWGEGLDDSEVLNRLIDEVAHFCEKSPNEVSRLSLREFSSLFSKSQAQQTKVKRSVTPLAAEPEQSEGNGGGDAGRPILAKGEIMADRSLAIPRLGLLLVNIRDGLRQFLDAFQAAITGEGNVKWRGFCLEILDPGNGGIISVPEETPHVTFSNFGIFRDNIPVCESDIDTAARCLETFELPHDAKRLRDELQNLKDAFCSSGEYVQHPDGVVTNRKFYARECADALWKHVNQLIGTVDAMFPAGGQATELLSDKHGIEEQMQRVALAVGDDNAAKIMAIAQRRDLSGDEKMQEIVNVDSRFGGKNSAEWGTLLGVTPAAIRGYKTWKTIQHAMRSNG
jgi:hypothetical protein